MEDLSRPASGGAGGTWTTDTITATGTWDAPAGVHMVRIQLWGDRIPPPPAAPPNIVINNNTEAAPAPNVTVQPPNIIVQPAAVTVEAAPAPVINVDARTTIEEGALSVEVKGGDKKIEIKRDNVGRMTGASVKEAP